jgi:hypothetical protein
MLRLTEDVDLRRQLGSSAMDWAMQRLCHKQMAVKTQQLYMKVLTAYQNKTSRPTTLERLGSNVVVSTS